MDNVLLRLNGAIEILASFFEKIANWIAHDYGAKIPPAGISFIKALSITLAIYILWPAIRTTLKKAPGLVEKFIKLFTELLEQLLDALKTVISEKIPVVARFIANPTSYSRIVLWCAATDHEALAVATSNGSGVNRRLLSPYHGQFVLGLVVLLLSAWSGLGLSFAVYMSLRGKVDYAATSSGANSITSALSKAGELGNYEIAGVIIAGCFFCLMIMAVDRTIVSTIKKTGHPAEWARTVAIWVLRIIVSLVLASWIAETYSVFLNRHLIEEHLSRKLDKRISELETARLQADKGKESYIETNAPRCHSAKVQFAKIPDRLKQESLKCPPSHKTGGECKGPEFKAIQAEGKELANLVDSECTITKLGLPEYLSAPGIRLDADIAKAKEEKRILAYDISQGSDALQEIGHERHVKRHPKPTEVDFFDACITWLTFSPHKTFMVLLVIDLLPLIVKMLVRSSYFSVLERAEELREGYMTYMPRLATPTTNRRKIGWNPLFSMREPSEPERRSALP